MAAMRRYRAGERFRPSAADLNRIADAVERLGRVEPVADGAARPELATHARQATILVRNDADVDVPRFGVLDVGPPIFGPEVNQDEFSNRVSLTGLRPRGPTRHGIVLVPQQTILSGRIGRCVMQGLTVSLIAVRDSRHTHAELAEDQVVLRSAFAGPAQIIWLAPPPEEPEDPDVRLALVVLAPVNRTFDAVVTATSQVGSSWRWTYEVEERVYDGTGALVDDAEGLRTVTAFSKLERYNVVGDQIAPGVLQSDNPSATITALPIDIGTPVEVEEIFPAGWERGDPPVYAIRPLPNPIKVECA
jgi:hypothetical protein